MKNVYEIPEPMFDNLSQIARRVEIAFWRGNFERAREIVDEAETVRRSGKLLPMTDPVVDDEPDHRPDPQPKPQPQGKPMSSTPSDIENAIAILTDPNAGAVIDEKIAELETQLGKLKLLRKTVRGKTKSAKSTPVCDSALEASIVQHIRDNGPGTATEIATAIGSSRLAIGKVVARSELLEKDAYAKILLA